MTRGVELPDRIVPEDRLPLSALLLMLADDVSGDMNVARVVEHFGARSFGAVLFAFAIPNLLPFPPGSSTVLGLPLLVVAPQLACGAKKPWIPRTLRQRRVDRAALAGLCRRAAPWVERMERLTTPRLGFMFGAFGDPIIGIVCTLMAAILILPIPLGNLLPAVVIVTLAFSLIQRDGLLAFVGYFLALISAAVLLASGHLVIAAVARLGSMTGLWPAS